MKLLTEPVVRRTAANVLEFVGQSQEQSEWCWAAACASVSSFYAHRSKGRHYRQCDIVQEVLFPHRNINCCNDPARCNVEGPMDGGMRFIGHFACLTNGAVDLDTICAELDSQRPIGVRVRLATGQEHIVVIYGYDLDSRLRVWNPARGRIETDMNNWVRHLGWWQNTCLTK
jgi:hypothetical protein